MWRHVPDNLPTADRWRGSEEFSSDIAKVWIQELYGSPRYILVPVPNHGLSEMEHGIGWVDKYTERQ